jgi:hypothetical protein
MSVIEYGCWKQKMTAQTKQSFKIVRLSRCTNALRLLALPLRQRLINHRLHADLKIFRLNQRMISNR